MFLRSSDFGSHRWCSGRKFIRRTTWRGFQWAACATRSASGLSPDCQRTSVHLILSRVSVSMDYWHNVSVSPSVAGWNLQTVLQFWLVHLPSIRTLAERPNEALRKAYEGTHFEEKQFQQMKSINEINFSDSLSALASVLGKVVTLSRPMRMTSDPNPATLEDPSAALAALD